MIYIVKTYKDIIGAKSSLDDCKLYVFDSMEKAKNKIHEMFCNSVNAFDEDKKDYLKIIFTEDYYEVTNDEDYFAGEILVREVI